LDSSTCDTVIHVFLCCQFFFFQAEDGIRDFHVTGVQTCALPISTTKLPGSAQNSATDSASATRLRRSPASQLDQGARGTNTRVRSEERRVGKECRSRRSPEH